MLYYFLSFISGFLVKAVDWIEDDLKKPLFLRWPIAIAAGAIIGYLIGEALFSVLFLAALFAQVVARKVDKPSHAITALVAAIVFAFLGVPAFELWIFALFVVAAFLDELEFPGEYAALSEYRVFLNVVGLVFGILVGQWYYFFGILSFDAGYLAFKFSVVKGEVRVKRRK